ncbi:MAG: hypothetical protein AABM30_09375 [Actinomycetota bacterium]
MTGLDLLATLRAFVKAHAQPHPSTEDREPIFYFIHSGGGTLQHHALDDPPPKVDEALLEEMRDLGVIDIDYSQGTWKLTPTPEGRRTVEAQDRIESRGPIADITPLAAAVSAQANSANKLAWPAVRPVLAELRSYWEAGGFSSHGIQLPALANVLPEEHQPLFSATVRSLVDGDYLRPTNDFSAFEMPAEVVLTTRAHTVLDGWPGAAPDELFENLVAVLAAAIASEPDPVRKKRLERLAGTIKEVGVEVTAEVVSKVLLGGV